MTTKTQILEMSDAELSKTPKPRCAVNGFLGKQGKYSAMCMYISVGSKSVCCADDGFECTHKIKALAELNKEGL